MSGVFVDEFQTIVKVVNRAVGRMFSRQEVIDATNTTATIRVITGDGTPSRHDVVPVLLARRPIGGDRVAVLDAPSLGGQLVLGVIAQEGDVDVLEELQDQIDALDARVTALEP